MLTTRTVALTAWLGASLIFGGSVSSAAAVTLGECAAMMDGELPSFVPTDFYSSGNVRKYYVRAEIDEWDYIPSGTLPLCGRLWLCH